MLSLREIREPHEKYELNLTSTEEDKGCFMGGKTVWLKYGDEPLTNEQSWVICLFGTQCMREKSVEDDTGHTGWSQIIKSLSKEFVCLCVDQTLSPSGMCYCDKHILYIK